MANLTTIQGTDVVANSRAVINANFTALNQELATLTSALKTRVAMPANTAASGAVGEYAVDGGQLAIYVSGTGWVFYTGFTK